MTMAKIALPPRVSAHPCPVWCVGTYDPAGKPNVMTAAWGGIVCSKPPCISVSMRKAPYSHGNVLARGAYTVSVAPARYAREADYFGLESGREADKFSVAGLTPVRSLVVDAPYVGEFPLVLECRLLQTVELGLHTMFVGEVLGVLADDDVLTDGKPDLAKIDPLVFDPDMRTYHAVRQPVGPAFSMGLELRSKP